MRQSTLLTSYPKSWKALSPNATQTTTRSTRTSRTLYGAWLSTWVTRLSRNKLVLMSEQYSPHGTRQSAKGREQTYVPNCPLDSVRYLNKNISSACYRRTEAYFPAMTVLVNAAS